MQISPDHAPGSASDEPTDRPAGEPAGEPSILSRIARLLAPYRGKLGLVALAVVAAAALTSVAPFLTQAVFDRALFPPQGDPDLELLGWLVGGLVVIPVLAALIGVGQTYLTTRVGNEAMADLRGDLFEHLETMELGFFTSTKTGSIQSRLANDVSGVRTVLTDTASTILSNVVTVTAALISMLLLSWQLTVISLILMPVFVMLQLAVGRRQRLARRTQESLSEMTAITEEALSVSGILLAKVFNRADDEIERYRRENRRQTRLQVKASMMGQSFFAVVSTFFAITPAVVYLVVGFLMTGSATLTAGTVVAFTTLQARLQMPLMQLMRVSLDVQISLALFRRIFEYLDLVPAIQDRPGAVALEPDGLRGEVELRDVWFRYPEARSLSEIRRQDVAVGSSRGRPGGRLGLLDTAATTSARQSMPSSIEAETSVPDEQQGERVVAEEYGAGRPPEVSGVLEPVVAAPSWALQGLTLRVRPGQLAAIVGPSGSGKTTLTYLIPRFYDVTRGQVLIDGHDVREVTMSSLADTVGMVTQEPYLFHATIADNIRYAKPAATDDEVEQAAHDANIHDRASSASSTATGRSPASAATGSPAARSSDWRSPASCSWTRACSSSTRRPARWTTRPSAWCRRHSSGRWTTGRRSRSRTVSARSRTPT